MQDFLLLIWPKKAEIISLLDLCGGEYLVLDRECRGLVHHVLYPVPVGETKGILVSPTTDGNILVGPNLSQWRMKTLPPPKRD